MADKYDCTEALQYAFLTWTESARSTDEPACLVLLLKSALILGDHKTFVEITHKLLLDYTKCYVSLWRETTDDDPDDNLWAVFCMFEARSNIRVTDMGTADKLEQYRNLLHAKIDKLVWEGIKQLREMRCISCTYGEKELDTYLEDVLVPQISPSNKQRFSWKDRMTAISSLKEARLGTTTSFLKQSHEIPEDVARCPNRLNHVPHNYYKRLSDSAYDVWYGSSLCIDCLQPLQDANEHQVCLSGKSLNMRRIRDLWKAAEIS